MATLSYLPGLPSLK